MEFTSKVLADDRVRIVGVCFGHQIVGRALGAKVGPSDDGWEVSVYDAELTEQGKQILGIERLVPSLLLLFPLLLAYIYS